MNLESHDPHIMNGKKFDEGGREALVRKKPIPLSHPKQLPQGIVDKILDIRKTYYLGPQRS